jgi:hypothetical protein
LRALRTGIDAEHQSKASAASSDSRHACCGSARPSDWRGPAFASIAGMDPQISNVTSVSACARVVALAIALAISMPGCWQPPPAAPAPEIQKELLIDAPLDVVWNVAVEWFAKNGMPIKNLDKVSGLIATDHDMSIDKAAQLMSCGASGPNAEGKTEQVGHRGNFNLVLREQADGRTKASVNAFFSCTENVYKYVGILSTDMQLASTARKDCSSTGRVERQLLGHLGSIRYERPEPSAAEPTPAPTATPATSTPPTSAVAPPPTSACASDADCRAGRVCRAGSCTSPTCAKDVDCPEPQICEAGACAPPSPPRPAP